ncbi:hypothetical protein EDB86DRAFT_381248 [Lactarius hatsudake]|nr:hypothetical protein EDB86DRAFT_381248 [Lactarius hatsudake]
MGFRFPETLCLAARVAWILALPVVNFLSEILQADMRFRLLPETFYPSVSIIDRFLSVRVVSLAQSLLVCFLGRGTACSQLPVGGPSGGHALPPPPRDTLPYIIDRFSLRMSCLLLTYSLLALREII